MNHWETEIIGKNHHAIRFRIKNANQYLTFKQVFSLWGTDADFRTFYISILEDCEYDAYYWEHPGLKFSFLDRPYEFILQKSTSLDFRRVDDYSFSSYFERGVSVVDFDNLGKNARLIVPAPLTDVNEYKHLAKFIRSNQTEQKHELLKRVGEVMNVKMKNGQFVWLNTAGNGVIWLHIRLDSRPKYYKTKNYKRADFLEKKEKT